MKKRFFSIIILVLYLTVNSTSALALDVYGDIDQRNESICATVSNSLAVRRKTIDLSSETANVNLNAGAGSVVTSANYYETNSQKISIKLKCSKSIIVKVSLYDIEGNTIGEETKELGGIFNTTWTFRSLSSNKVYFFEVENLGQIDVAITGTVTD